MASVNVNAKYIFIVNMLCPLNTAKKLLNLQNGVAYQKLSNKFVKFCWGWLLYTFNLSGFAQKVESGSTLVEGGTINFRTGACK